MKQLKLFALFAALLFASLGYSQHSIGNLKLDTRFDFDYQPDKTGDSSGFNGKYLNIVLDGKINDRFSYRFRHRMQLNGYESYRGFFRQTDMAYLSYWASDEISLSAGKQVVAIGGFEYDYAPIDVFFWSDFWNNITCYQIGASINYIKPNHNFGFQITSSPFARSNLSSLYAYNLIWYGDMDWFKTIYSINMIEYAKDRFTNYIALGNQFHFGDFILDFDYMNRTSDKADNYFVDFSIIANLKFKLGNFMPFIKGGYDQNKAEERAMLTPFDLVVRPGVEYAFGGIGTEYFPIKDKDDIRLHAFWAMNNNPTHKHTFNIGVRWQMKIIENK